LNDLGIPVSHEQTSDKWNATNANADKRREQLNEALSTQQTNDTHSKAFADKASAADKWLHSTGGVIQATKGDLESQLQSIRALNLEEGRRLLEELQQIADELARAGVRSNPYTELSLPSISARVGELSSAKAGKEAVLEKEILSKKHSQASPEQIEEFKEVFRHFDKNSSGSLSKSEFKSCLQSLGEDPSDSALENLYASLADVNYTSQAGDSSKQIGFDKFLEYMIKITSDSTTQDEIATAFRALAQDKDFITADDLRRSGMPTEKVEYLLAEIPPYASVEGGLDYKKWAANAFAR